jgi:hypothetical protein
VPGCRPVGAWCVTNSFGGFSGNDLEFGEPYEGKEGEDSRRLILCYLSARQKEEQIYCYNYKKRMTVK